MEEKNFLSPVERFEKWFEKQGLAALEKLKKDFVRFPVTQGAIWLVTLIFVIYTGDYYPGWIDKLLMLLVFYGIGSFLSESLFPPGAYGRVRCLLYALSGVPALLFTILSHPEDISPFLEQHQTVIEAYTPRYLACYLILLLSASFYYCYKHSSLTPQEYLVRVFSGFMRTGIIYFVLAIGVSIVMGIFIELFDADFERMLQAHLLLYGLYFVSSLLHCVPADQPEDGRFMEGMIKYVLTGLVISAFVIIYAYILKILIFLDIPSNSLFRILSGLFIAGFPIWMMNSHFKENNPLLKVSRLLPACFVPLIFLQIYSIGIRIYRNGVTPMRYACVLLVLFEIIYFIVYFLRREHIGILFAALAAFSLTAFCLPGVNMYHTSFKSQQRALQKYFNTADYGELNSKEMDRFEGAYRYLKYDFYGESYLDSLPAAETAKLAYFDEAPVDTRNEKYYGWNQSMESMDISGFDICYPVSLYRSESECMTGFCTLSYGDGQTVTLDLHRSFDIFLNAPDEYEDSENYHTFFLSHNRIRLDANRTLLLESLNAEYSLDDNCYTHFSIQGYLLEKS